MCGGRSSRGRVRKNKTTLGRGLDSRNRLETQPTEPQATSSIFGMRRLFGDLRYHEAGLGCLQIVSRSSTLQRCVADRLNLRKALFPHEIAKSKIAPQPATPSSKLDHSPRLPPQNWTTTRDSLLMGRHYTRPPLKTRRHKPRPPLKSGRHKPRPPLRTGRHKS